MDSKTTDRVVSMKKQAGFTLIEILVVLAVIGVVSSLGYPSFREMLKRNAVQAATSDIVNALMITRSEAVKVNMPVTFCQSLPGSTRTCSNQNDWNKGWIVTRGGTVIAASDGAGDKVVIRSKSGTTLKSSLIYTGEARVQGGDQSFSICSKDAKNAIQIIIDPTGRPRVTSVGATCF